MTHPASVIGALPCVDILLDDLSIAGALPVPLAGTQELAGRPAGWIIDVAIENVGYLYEGRILGLSAYLSRTDPIVEDTVAAPDGGLPISKQVIGDTDPWAPVVPVRRRAARW